ncbi:MAG: DUF2189 domain-containing protein [Caulobacteraceae bacterium]
MGSLTFNAMPTAHAAPGVRKIDRSDLNWALAKGWKDFQEKRGDLILLALIYPLVAFMAAAITYDGRLFAMFFPLVAGLSILGPAVATGFYELARRREAGQDSSWMHFFDPMNGRSRVELVILTGGLAILFAGWLVCAALIYDTTVGRFAPAGPLDFLHRLFTTPEGWAMIVVGNLVGGGFAVATLVLGLTAFPMAVDRPGDPLTAVTTSIRAVEKNPVAVATWGAWVAALLALGCATAFIGLAVVLPVLGYASWHLYTRLVER